MIEINNKYNYGEFVKYRVWDQFTQSYSEHKGHIVGINYIDLQQGPIIMYGIIEYLEYTNKDEIEHLGVKNEYEYFMKYCTGKYNEHRFSVTWAAVNDILNIETL